MSDWTNVGVHTLPSTMGTHGAPAINKLQTWPGPDSHLARDIQPAPEPSFTKYRSGMFDFTSYCSFECYSYQISYNALPNLMKSFQSFMEISALTADTQSFGFKTPEGWLSTPQWRVSSPADV